MQNCEHCQAERKGYGRRLNLKGIALGQKYTTGKKRVIESQNAATLRTLPNLPFIWAWLLLRQIYIKFCLLKLLTQQRGSVCGLLTCANEC